MSTGKTSNGINIRTFFSEEWSDESPESVLSKLPGRKPLLLGLPCARCRAYYDATLDSCPVCGCREQVSAQACRPVVCARSRAA